MNKTKENILQAAFKLFMLHGYEKTSMETLQVEVNLSRGAIYHHFTNKKKILDAVIEEYLLESISTFKDTDSIEKRSLLETINIFLSKREKIIEYLRQITNYETQDYHYFKLIFIANEYYEGFNDKINNLNIIELQFWKSSLENAIASGEISNKIDVETTALTLMIIPRGIGLASSFNTGIDISKLSSSYLEYYKLLK